MPGNVAAFGAASLEDEKSLADLVPVDVLGWVFPPESFGGLLENIASARRSTCNIERMLREFVAIAEEAKALPAASTLTTREQADDVLQKRNALRSRALTLAEPFKVACEERRRVDYQMGDMGLVMSQVLPPVGAEVIALSSLRLTLPSEGEALTE